ncbi:MAG TPA: hypothetical protein VLQ78_12960 [Ornithinibacter sp.]|nr:hypothetical protein [Ornithinibacter sp.]
MTLRRGEVGVGHPLQRWLADVRRMPCLTELPLSSFDRGGTRDQVHALLDAPPHESLVTDVHTRTGGNAYLNRLLVEDLPSDARHLGGGLPDDLRGAVLRPWHRLSERSRELVLAVAVGVRSPPAQRAALLSRLREAAAEHVDHEAEYGAVEALLTEVDEGADPLLVAELLVRREHLRFSTGRGFPPRRAGSARRRAVASVARRVAARLCPRGGGARLVVG